ncbi:MAG: hypothetical protein H6510_17470 [Acidobacteria bacterium]|nr:hypothetical protein [Acidobacteriota bacterium]MCB9399605.1 hypothetical protein [Acidobacteriota bacterium]
MVGKDLKEQGYDKEEEYFKRLEREQLEKLKQKKEPAPQNPQPQDET